MLASGAINIDDEDSLRFLDEHGLSWPTMSEDQFDALFLGELLSMLNIFDEAGIRVANDPI